MKENTINRREALKVIGSFGAAAIGPGALGSTLAIQRKATGESLPNILIIVFDRRPWISLSEHDVVLPNGASIEGYITWEVREYALTVAITEMGIPLARQYKHGVRSFSFDLPGGYLNDNETPLAAATRELLEETGLIAKKWIHLSSLVLDNNRGPARSHLFLASDIHVASPPNLDETEELLIDYFDWTELISMVKQGRISSLPTVAALYMAMDHLREN